MAVTIPSIDELYNQILNDLASEFNIDVTELGKSYLADAKVQAGMLYTLYLALSGVQKNTFYDLAQEDQLIRYGEIILGRKPAPAEAGEYEVSVIGQIGATITAGTQFRANDDTLAAGNLFVVDSDFVLSASPDSLPIRALTPGTDAALLIADKLTSTAPIVNVNSEVEVSAITKQAVEAEDIASYRADVILAAQIEPQGGSPGDYRLWASDVPEVRNTYVYAEPGNGGNVLIYVESTIENTAPGEVDGVPTQATIDEVYKNDNNIETGAIVINPITAKGRKPVGVFEVTILPVDPNPVNLVFTGLSDESIVPQIRTAIDQLLYDIRPFVAGADLLKNKKDILTIGQVIAAVISVIANTGITYTNLTIEVNAVAVNEYQFLLGNYPYLNIITNDGTPV